MRRPPTATRMDLAGEMASSPAGGTVAQGVGGASDEMMLGAGNELVSSTLSCATSTSSATPLRTGRTNKLGTMHSKLGLSSLSSLSQWSTGRPLAPITPLLWAMSPMGGWEAVRHTVGERRSPKKKRPSKAEAELVTAEAELVAAKVEEKAAEAQMAMYGAEGRGGLPERGANGDGVGDGDLRRAELRPAETVSLVPLHGLFMASRIGTADDALAASTAPKAPFTLLGYSGPIGVKASSAISAVPLYTPEAAGSALFSLSLSRPSTTIGLSEGGERGGGLMRAVSLPALEGT